MKQSLLRAIRINRLWEPGMTVAIAVSGGRDSMVLLDALVATRGLHKAHLSVVHVDHGLSPESADWALWVGQQARKRGLRVTSRRVDCEPSESAAREARYAVFETLAVDRVALAHHAQDQAETVLIHAMRGTGPRGLAGMPMRRGRYVRPMLRLGAGLLHSWQRRWDVAHLEDPSNRDERYLRNRVRQHVLPLLEQTRQGSVEALARSATLAAEDEVYLSHLAGALSLRVVDLRAAAIPLVRRRLHQLVPEASMGQVEAMRALLESGRGVVELSGGRRVVADGYRIRVE